MLHGGIEAIAEAMGLPLVRRELHRRAVEQGMVYEYNADDEVEDLFDLLADVKARVRICIELVLSRARARCTALARAWAWAWGVRSDRLACVRMDWRTWVRFFFVGGHAHALQFPDVEGVSCGAILSNYQRLRVENCCRRLGLTVLAYLWQRDQVTPLHITAHHGAVRRSVTVHGTARYVHTG